MALEDLLSQEGVSGVAEQIGDSMRAARKAAGRTLSDVAGETGLSESFLSKIERGHANCSLANLIQICAVLGIGMDNLFSKGLGAQRTNVSVHRAMPGNPGAVMLDVESTGYKFRPLAGGKMRDDLEIIHLVFPSKSGMETMVSHAGQEHCYVLSGSVEFLVDGSTHILNAGDGIMIDSKLPHLARNRGKDSAHVLMTVAMAGSKESPPDWWSVVGPTVKTNR